MLIRRLRATALVCLAAVALVACGSEDARQERQPASKGTPAEMAFLAAMVHHHDTAIQMAKIAQQRGRSSFVKRLATTIIGDQQKEIAAMRSIHQRLFARPLKPDPMAHDRLGLSAEEAGMTHTPAHNAELSRAKPFDRAFVDAMVPHHRGAIPMAEVVMRDGRDPELRRLAGSIISAQKREVDEMNAFRKRTYGAPVPGSASAGGAKEELPPAGGEHGGH